jgi:hypothetical protein
VPGTLAALLAAGCAGGRDVTRPSIAVRSSLHRVAVTVRVEPAAAAMHTPPTGVFEGMGEGAATPFRAYGQCAEALVGQGGANGDPQGTVLILGLGAGVAAVASVGGAIGGAFATVPEEDVERWTAVFRGERADAGPDLGLADAVRRAVAESGTPVRADDGPAADATLDVVLREPAVVCEWVFSKSAVLVFEAAAELRPQGAAPVPLGSFRFVSGRRPFLQWAEAPSPISAELRLGARQVAEAIVDYALRLETKDGR